MRRFLLAVWLVLLLALPVGGTSANAEFTRNSAELRIDSAYRISHLTSHIPHHIDPHAYWLGVERVECPPSGCWRVLEVGYQDETQSGGRHHIDVLEPHDPALTVLISNGVQTWPEPLEKPLSEPAVQFGMWAGNVYSAQMEGAPSDRVTGMTMRGPDEDSAWQAHHVVYQLTFVYTIEEEQEPTPEPTPTVPEADYHLYLPVVSHNE